MSVFDPFSTFGQVYSFDDGGDVFANAPVGATPPTVGITGEVNRRADQGFFGGLFEGAQDFLGFASEGLQFVEQFGIGPEQDFNHGYLPGDYYPPPAQASGSLLSMRIGGVPILVILGAGAALWLATR